VSESLSLFLSILVIGVGATVTMDIVAVVLHRVLGTTSPDYTFVGRWVGHMAHAQFRHESIATATPVAGERAIGWFIHYVTGIAYAALLLAIWGGAWAHHPTLLPALVVGLGTIVVPFLIMQPAFGLGIASSRHPSPAAARLRSLTAHFIFGLGLYFSGLVDSLLQGSG
jgi:Protein of unknown function (DUF2938)